MQFGWSKPHPTKAMQIADLSNLDKWLRGIHKMGQSPVKKPLKDMSPNETSTVIFALEEMVKKKHEK